ncbi:MAG: twin-arginine translocase TatA/TatE family subunit [Kiritimatiellae bacterium]|nr:twin-arginine translocase TatA/TatE family subunit [Kiritimatiellia bacterium]MBR4604209.1 twin-arginine translocase TatA/TatE family subunit [Kiritimatiellia bacterium]
MDFAFIASNAGFGEWLVMLAVVLVVAGPKRLPTIARELGRYYAKFRRVAEGFKRELFEIDETMRRTEAAAEKGAKDFFVIEGNEATAKPALEA